MTVSPVAEQLSGIVSPPMQDALNDRREAIIHDAGGILARGAARVIFPVVVGQLPNITGAGVDALLTHFGGMSVSDLVSLLVHHMQAKGLSVHPSLTRASISPP